jgi:hypothetical protein
MIRIARDRSAAGIPAGFRGNAGILKQRLLLDVLHGGTLPKDLAFKSTVWKPAKKALKHETWGKCAYCEVPAAGRSKTDAKGGLVAHCDVEHFRPKDLYWWLAHCFENYLFSCQVCNQSFKGNQFPVAAARVSAPVTVTGAETVAELDTLAALMAPDPLDAARRAAWAVSLHAEDADLTDPLQEEPEEFFKYEADETLKEVTIRPRAASGRKKARAASTIAVLGLDREELRFGRYDVYEQVDTFRLVLADPGLSAATRQRVSDQLGRLMAASRPFSGMVRYFVNDVWALAIPPADPP